MKNPGTLILFLIFSHLVRAQTESVHLHFDKTIAYPSDTCWFTAYIFDNNYPSHYSKNLYVELYDELNNLSLRKVFPIVKGISIGQLEFPKKSGLFWVRAYTSNSSYFIESVSIRSSDNAVIVRNMLEYKNSPVTSEIAGFLINSIYTKRGISCTIFPNSENIYIGEKIDLVVKYYDAKIGEYSFVLSKNRQRNILISRDSLNSHIHGYVSLLFYKSDTLIGKQNLFISQREIPVEFVKDTFGYIFRIKDSVNWNYSLSVVNLRGESNSLNILHSLFPPRKRKEADTSYLTYYGTVNSTIGKASLIKDEDMIVMFGKDSMASVKLLPIDHSGNLSFSGLYFFDTAYLCYMLNGYSGDRLSDVRITLTPHEYPKFVSPDSTDFEMDTLNMPYSLDLPDLDTVKYLKPVFVESGYNRALDNRYTSGVFSWPAHFSFDLIRANKHNYSILDYLNVELPWFSWNCFADTPPLFKMKPVVIYLDEELVNWKELITTNIRELAYVKIIEDFPNDDPYVRAVSEIGRDLAPSLAKPDGKDNSPSAMICIYRRRDKDLSSMPGNLLRLPIKGYDRPLKWRSPDRSTVLWMPNISIPEVKFTLPSSAFHSLKIRIEGMNEIGEMLFFEKEID